MTDEEREAKRVANRARFPAISEIMDQVRVHCLNAKLDHGLEDGKEVGKEPEYWKSKWAPRADSP